MGVAAVGARGGWRGGRVRSGVCRALASSASRKKTAGGVRPAGRRRRLAVGCSIRSTCSLPGRLLPLAISLLLRTETKSDSTSVASLTEGLPGLDPLDDGREDHLRGRPTSGPYCTIRSDSRRCRLSVQESTFSCCRTALQSASTTARIEPCKNLVMRARRALCVKALEH